MHIGNDYKVVTATGRRPRLPTAARPIDREAMRALRQNLGVGAWNGSGGLYGTKAQVREARRRVKRALAGKVMRLRFVDDRLLAVMGRFARPFRMLTGWDVSHTLKVIEPVYNLMRGVPTDSTLASTYWRKPAECAGWHGPRRRRLRLALVQSRRAEHRARSRRSHGTRRGCSAPARVRAADFGVADHGAQFGLRSSPSATTEPSTGRTPGRSNVIDPSRRRSSPGAIRRIG